mmetsp:Transcript_1078/g.3985  ORF Transcript_1078/g.3985 Transcript_1078/m.3985 type:complete len:403 (-) Transcript_1078:157-1365(-)
MRPIPFAADQRTIVSVSLSASRRRSIAFSNWSRLASSVSSSAANPLSSVLSSTMSTLSSSFVFAFSLLRRFSAKFLLPRAYLQETTFGAKRVSATRALSLHANCRVNAFEVVVREPKEEEANGVLASNTAWEAFNALSRNGFKTSRRPILNIAAIERVAPTATKESSDAATASAILSFVDSSSPAFFLPKTLISSLDDQSRYSPRFNSASGRVNNRATQIAARSLATSANDTHCLHIPNKSSINPALFSSPLLLLLLLPPPTPPSALLSKVVVVVFTNVFISNGIKTKTEIHDNNVALVSQLVSNRLSLATSSVNVSLVPGWYLSQNPATSYFAALPSRFGMNLRSVLIAGSKSLALCGKNRAIVFAPRTVANACKTFDVWCMANAEMAFDDVFFVSSSSKT